jgi:hypothetical protein
MTGHRMPCGIRVILVTIFHSMKIVSPAWFRVTEAERYCSLSRTALFEGCTSGEIESIHLVKPGKKKGIRLINKESLDAYIRSFLPGGSRYQKRQKVEA